MLAPKAGAPEPHGDTGRDSLIPEIPCGMQPGPISSSHCGRWIRAHQWLAETISLTELKPFLSTGVRDSRSPQKQSLYEPTCLSAVIQQTLARVSTRGRSEERRWQRGFLRKHPLHWLASRTTLLRPEDFAECARKSRG
ncbi:unnamed protein product [Pleuronectes platessa]|uniref:Uncharacterized protein n=1 Tax=Pleuronectes platessa TaxID=8262 RepID=A0A9N7V8N6_PLEPL|nr:unnamed protein product [Pleuronectes platessa]